MLREEWGFNGHVVSDYYAIPQMIDLHHVAADKATPRNSRSKQASILSCRIPMLSRRLLQLVKDGQVSEATLNQAVARNLRAKFLLGLFENPYVDVERAVRVTNSSEHRALAAEAARSSITLLKNENNLLPLNLGALKSIAVIGPNAAQVHLGGYSDDPGAA